MGIETFSDEKVVNGHGVTSTVSSKEIGEAVNSFLAWLKKNGYASHDQYDFWATSFGKLAKKIYYRNHLLGAPLVGPLVFLDTFLPQSRKLISRRKRFPISDAHLVMGLVNLFNLAAKEGFLQQAEDIGDELLKASIPGYSGHCWGYPFDWQTNRGLWKKGTPLITTTPYCFEAFLRLYDTTKKQKYLDIAYSAFEFALNDLVETEESRDATACSYSPVDNSKVVNANAYRASMLMEGFRRFGEVNAREKAIRNINFVLRHQNNDGSWLYAIENPQDAFIDNFHTCFVLKNLYKANTILNDENLRKAIGNGYRYYRENLFYSDGTPKPYSMLGRFAGAKIEMYDYAEGISLGVLLHNEFSDAVAVANRLVKDLIIRFQLPDGHFVTRVNVLSARNKTPYLRWPQAQLFHALTCYYRMVT